MREHGDTPVDAGLFGHPVASAGTGVPEPVNYRSFLQIPGRLPSSDDDLMNDPVLLLLLEGGDAELLDVDSDGVALHLGSVRPGEVEGGLPDVIVVIVVIMT